MRPLPSAEVVLSSPSKRYYGPLRLPGQPDGDFSVRLIRRGWIPVIHWPGSPVVPAGAVLACHPCYPGGPPVTWQRWWSPERRSSSPDNGVDALTEVHEAPSGFAARYGLRGCALTSVSARQGTWGSGLPGVPTGWVPSLKLPGRAARSRGRTFTGEFQSIHGILSGTFFRSLTVSQNSLRALRSMTAAGHPPAGGAGLPCEMFTPSRTMNSLPVRESIRRIPKSTTRSRITGWFRSGSTRYSRPCSSTT